MDERPVEVKTYNCLCKALLHAEGLVQELETLSPYRYGLKSARRRSAFPAKLGSTMQTERGCLSISAKGY
jgi:hypothetical protein